MMSEEMEVLVLYMDLESLYDGEWKRLDQIINSIKTMVISMQIHGIMGLQEKFKWALEHHFNSS